MLTGMSNLLNDYPAQIATNVGEFYQLVSQYVKQHTLSTAINGTSPWIGEDIHPDLGYVCVVTRHVTDMSFPLVDRTLDLVHEE